jgi:hypothetical protein
MAIKNPQPFVDPCSTPEDRVPNQPGAQAFIDPFRGLDAFIVGERTTLTIDGHDGGARTTRTVPAKPSPSTRPR